MRTVSRFGSLEGVPSRPDVSFYMLAKERYTSQAFHELEAESLWPRVWQLACREEELPEPGDFFEYRILDQSIMIVRQIDDRIKAFYNTCRHRGTALVCGSGHVSEFRCPFHAWTYGLDGTLRSIPSPDEFCPNAEYSLADCRVETWGGFVFLNLDDAAPPLAEFLDPVPMRLASYHLENWACTRAVTMLFQCNWKVVIDAFSEAYHVVGTHPQLLLAFDDVNTEYENVGIHSHMVTPFFVPSPRVGEVPESAIVESLAAAFEESMDDGGGSPGSGIEVPPGVNVREFMIKLRREGAAAQGVDLNDLTDDQLSESDCWGIFPNMCLQMNGDECLGWRARPNENDPNSCLIDMTVYRPVPAGTARKPVEWEFQSNWRDHEWGLTLRQDYENLPRIQAGMRQKGCAGVVLGERQESRLRNFNAVLDGYIKAGPWSENESAEERPALLA